MEQGAGSMGQGAGGRSWKLGGGSWQIEPWRPRYGRHPVRHNPAPSCVAQNGILLCRRLGVGKPTIVCCDRFEFRCLALRICFGFRVPCFGFGALAPSPAGGGDGGAVRSSWPPFAFGTSTPHRLGAPIDLEIPSLALQNESVWMPSDQLAEKPVGWFIAVL